MFHLSTSANHIPFILPLAFARGKHIIFTEDEDLTIMDEFVDRLCITLGSRELRPKYHLAIMKKGRGENIEYE